MKVTFRRSMEAGTVFTEPDAVRIDRQQFIARKVPTQLYGLAPFFEMPLQHSGGLAEHHARDLHAHIHLARTVISFGSVQAVRKLYPISSYGITTTSRPRQGSGTLLVW